MRELKFRAWDIELKHMIVDSPISMAGIMQKHIRKSVDPNGKLIGGQYVIMQFTGLVDANGEDIYEGDVVEYPDYYAADEEEFTNMGEIIYEDGYFGVTNRETNDEMLCDMELRVAGNIYQNPELLEVNEDES